MMHVLDENTKKKIIGIISVLVPEARIYLFGSRARGTNAEYSDIDLALDAGKPLLSRDVDEVKSMFQESNIVYKIDVVDINSVNSAMRDIILREGILWK